MIWIIIAILNAWRLQGCERSNGRAEADYSLLQFPPSTHPSLLPSFPVKIFALPCTQPFSTVRSYDHTAKRERERQKVRGREEERRRKKKSLKAKKVKKKDIIRRLGQKTFGRCGRKAWATEDAHATVLNLFGSRELLPGRKKTLLFTFP